MIDQDLLSDLQVALIEPPDGGQFWPSDLWTRDEVLGALNQRQNRFLKQTLLLVKPAAIVLIATDHVVDLPADTIKVLSVVWRGVDGTIRELPRSESFEIDHVIPTWETTDATPLIYMEYDTPNRQIQIAPAPTIDGTLDLLYLATAVEVTGAGVEIELPAEIASPVLKYGVLADLLGKDGRGRDEARASYCEDRFQLGIDVARIILKGWA